MHKDFIAGTLTEESMKEMLSVDKTNQKPVYRIQSEKLERFINPDTSQKQAEDFIIKACDYYSKHLTRQKKQGCEVIYMDRFIVGLAPKESEYVINGVKYIVSSRFEPPTCKETFTKKIEKFICSDFADLTNIDDLNTLTDDYVCSTVGKEDK